MKVFKGLVHSLLYKVLHVVRVCLCVCQRHSQHILSLTAPINASWIKSHAVVVVVFLLFISSFPCGACQLVSVSCSHSLLCVLNASL